MRATATAAVTALGVLLGGCFELTASGQDAHICWTPARGVLCFLPPDTGG